MNTKQATQAAYSAVSLLQHTAQHAKQETMHPSISLTALEVELNAAEEALALARAALAELKARRAPINTDSPFIEDPATTCHELGAK